MQNQRMKKDECERSVHLGGNHQPNRSESASTFKKRLAEIVEVCYELYFYLVLEKGSEEEKTWSIGGRPEG